MAHRQMSDVCILNLDVRNTDIEWRKVLYAGFDWRKIKERKSKMRE